MVKLATKAILVVEDEASDLFSLERAFGKLRPEFELHIVETGQDAIHYLKGEDPYAGYPQPSMVILDLRLPGMSGLELLTWIRHHPNSKNLPVIALTAYGNRDLPRAYELGIDFYLLKPVEPKDLADVLQGLGLYQENTNPEDTKPKSG